MCSALPGARLQLLAHCGRLGRDLDRIAARGAPGLDAAAPGAAQDGRRGRRRRDHRRPLGGREHVAVGRRLIRRGEAAAGARLPPVSLGPAVPGGVRDRPLQERRGALVRVRDPRGQRDRADGVGRSARVSLFA